MKRIKLKMGLTSAVITAAVIACVIIFNSIVALIGDKAPLTVDLTRDKVYEFSDQTKDLMKNLDAVLTAAGSSLEKAVKTTCFLSDMADFAAFNEVYGKYFTEKPARSCIAAKALPKGALVEVEVVAEIG